MMLHASSGTDSCWKILRERKRLCLPQRAGGSTVLKWLRESSQVANKDRDARNYHGGNYCGYQVGRSVRPK